MTTSPYITVNPPLVVRSSDAVGLLTGIRKGHALISWDVAPTQRNFAATITLPSGSARTWHGTQDGAGYKSSSLDDDARLTDLLHIIRKEQHIALCAGEDVEHSVRNHGFDDVELPHVALPDLSWTELDTTRTFLKTTFALPFIITGMTGGVDQAATINLRLAEAATRFKIPMGVGSQRIALENAEHAAIFTLKKAFPDLFLIGNIGIGQVAKSNALDLCRRAVDMIDADALAIHINVLQELIQVEGDRDFRGVLDRIGDIAERLGKPIIFKEVGTGMDTRTIQELFKRGIRAIDVGGSGGTSWARIEGLRSQDPRIQRLGTQFRDWGISTRDSLAGAVKLALPDLELVATGGMRDGVTALKAARLGATMVGFGLPLFKAALISAESVCDELESLATELKIAMMCSNSASLQP